VFSARCRNLEEHTKLAIHACAFERALVILGGVFCYGGSKPPMVYSENGNVLRFASAARDYHLALLYRRAGGRGSCRFGLTRDHQFPRLFPSTNLAAQLRALKKLPVTVNPGNGSLASEYESTRDRAFVFKPDCLLNAL